MAYYSDEPVGMVDALRKVRRIARVMSTPLRERIMVAASVRPIGVSSFIAEHGGGSFARVQANFKELRRYLWLVFSGTATGGRRRGGQDRLYRAVQFPLFDSSTWAVLPKPMRELYSLGSCSTFLEEAVKAMRAGTMDARPDRHLTDLHGFVDRRGWDRIIARIDTVFDPLMEEMQRADSRLADGEEQPIPATIAFAVYESPREPPGCGRSEELAPEAGAPRVSPHPYRVRMAKVMVDSLCMLALAELSDRSMSATQFYKEFGGGDITKQRVHRVFRTLKKFDWVDPDGVGTGERRRGGRERFYCAARPAIVDGVTWTVVPPSLRETESGATIDRQAGRMREAIEAGTVDERTDRALVWTPLVLDGLGWERTIATFDALRQFVGEELATADKRLAKSGDEPIPIAVALFAFESAAAQPKLH